MKKKVATAFIRFLIKVANFVALRFAPGEYVESYHRTWSLAQFNMASRLSKIASNDRPPAWCADADIGTPEGRNYMAMRAWAMQSSNKN